MTTPPLGSVSAAIDIGFSQTSSVLEWFGDNGRDLPWRNSRDPWSILVAEVMLQQTQVIRVCEKWSKFLGLFPTPQACADATLGEVIEAWAGLGFNRRAVNLRAAAATIIDFHEGHVPSGLTDLLALPGVGQYTTRAVRVFAFELDDGVLDTNVARILARKLGRKLKPSEAQLVADAAIPPGRSWEWNQALLDIGATMCVSRQPKCYLGCPLRESCDWFQGCLMEPDPAVGSAGVSKKQSRFAGSDRQGRGRLVEALRHGPIGQDALAEVMGWPTDRSRATLVAAQVVDDGLAVQIDGIFSLP